MPLQSKKEKSAIRNRDDRKESHGSLLHDVAVDDLNHDQSAVVGHDIEGLSLDIGILIGTPPQILPGQFGITSSLGLLSDRLDGLGAIDRFLSASYTGQTMDRMMRSAMEFFPGIRFEEEG